MKRSSLVVATLGTVFIGIGFGIWADPSVARAVGLLSLFEVVENPYFLALGIGILVAVFCFFIILTLPSSGKTYVELPSVESFVSTEQPGDEFETALAELVGRRGRAVRPTEHRELIERRLREDAVRTLTRVDDCDHAAARERVASGAWTDDRYAAAFVAEDVSGPKWWQSLRDWLVRADSFERSALRTAEAITNYDNHATASRGDDSSNEGAAP